MDPSNDKPILEGKRHRSFQYDSPSPSSFGKQEESTRLFGLSVNLPNAIVSKNSMLPAGFEPASEARKAPILDRTRLRERNGRLAA